MTSDQTSSPEPDGTPNDSPSVPNHDSEAHGDQDDSVVMAELKPTASPALPPKPRVSMLRRTSGMGLMSMLVAWVVVLALVAVIMLRPRSKQEVNSESSTGGVDFVVLEVQGKYLVGAVGLTKAASPNEEQVEKQRADLLKQMSTLNSGDLNHRLAYVVLCGELADPAEALSKLGELRALMKESDHEFSKSDLDLVNTLELLYSEYKAEQYSAPKVTSEQRELVTKRLGWYGDLALNSPEQSSPQRDELEADATQVCIVVVACVMVGMGYLAFGLLGCIVLFVLWCKGRLSNRLRAGADHGGVYMETFALWMVTFMVGGILSSFAPWPQAMLPLQVLVFFGSLVTLAWPVVRGVPWKTVKIDIGWAKPASWLEPVYGVISHASSIPLLFIGLMITLGLMQLAAGQAAGATADPLAPVPSPSHPAVEWMAHAELPQKLMIVLLACVAAPVVEETMFRGVLYRYLRDLTAHWRIALSVIASSFVSSFIFAAIHPQGWMAIPMLMSLAIGFALSREWRGSLIAPMFAHAFNNGVVMLLLVVLFA